MSKLFCQILWITYISLQLSISTPTPTTTTAICDNNCDGNNNNDNLRIDVSYWFSDRINYNLQNIECFLYKIFEQWFVQYEFAQTFSLCDINIIGISGIGTNELECSFPPCLDNDISNTKRMLLQNNYDGNTTMTIITNNHNTYSLINALEINTMISEFEAAFLTTFNVAINVEITVSEQVNENTNKNTFNPLYFIVLFGSILFCCIITVFVIYRIRLRKNKSETKPKRSTSGVSDIVEQTDNGYDMNPIEISNNKSKNELPKSKLKHKRSATIDSWDVSNISNDNNDTIEKKRINAEEDSISSNMVGIEEEEDNESSTNTLSDDDDSNDDILSDHDDSINNDNETNDEISNQIESDADSNDNHNGVVVNQEMISQIADGLGSDRMGKRVSGSVVIHGD